MTTKTKMDDPLADTRDDDGKLPTYAWPGGYQISYLAADNGVLCSACANGENRSDCTRDDLDPECPDDDQWRLVAGFVHWEGPPMWCDHCNTKIESEYGDPDNPEEG